MNKEGLTFEEWAYMAHCAKFRGENFLPMGEGFPRFHNDPTNRNAKIITRHYRYNYSKRIRDAWADGICPTDWMLDAQKYKWMRAND